jgi:hypothetical protein
MSEQFLSKALAFDPANANLRIEITQPINVIPNRFFLMDQLGLFEDVFLTQKHALVPVYTEVLSGALQDYNWGEKSQTLTPDNKQYLRIDVPHFPASYAITPQDVEGIAAWAQVYQGNDLETIEAVRQRKLAKARKAHAWVREVSRFNLITTGGVYAPRGTVTQNFYQQFGVSRTQIVTDLVASTTPDAMINNVVAALQDNLQSGEVVNRFIALCSPTYFQALINNPYITDILKAQLAGGTSNLLLNRQVGGLVPGDQGVLYRSFEYQGVTFYEVRPQAGTTFIPEGQAYFLPLGVQDLFTTYYATPNKFSTVNTVAQASYAWEFRDPKDEIIEIETESNLLNFVSRPQEIVVAYLPTGTVPVQPYTP